MLLILENRKANKLISNLIVFDSVDSLKCLIKVPEYVSTNREFSSARDLESGRLIME